MTGYCPCCCTLGRSSWKVTRRVGAVATTAAAGAAPATGGSGAAPGPVLLGCARGLDGAAVTIAGAASPSSANQLVGGIGRDRGCSGVLLLLPPLSRPFIPCSPCMLLSAVAVPGLPAWPWPLGAVQGVMAAGVPGLGALAVAAAATAAAATAAAAPGAAAAAAGAAPSTRPSGHDGAVAAYGDAHDAGNDRGHKAADAVGRGRGRAAHPHHGLQGRGWG